MKAILASLLLCGFAATFAADTTPAKTPPAAAKAPAASAELKALAASLTPAQKTRLMTTVNTGDSAALEVLPGIGRARAKSVKAARPFTGPLDLLRVDGIGEKVLTEILTAARQATARKPKAKA